MSGFVAVARGDGSCVENQLIERMTAAMAYRGPDGRAAQRRDGIALGYAAFDTTNEPPEAPQPWWLDGRIGVAADARIDDRDSLIARLAAAGRPDLGEASDAELLARAYDAFGDRMVEGLLGDFAFVIWDGERRRLFAARDQMGVKPCYYARAGDDLIVGNTLASFHAHPGVGDALDEYAIGDFLLFGLNRHPERTTFAQISRLPPAHTLSWEPGKPPKTQRYWRLAVREPISSSDDECVAAFREVLQAAVADRIRGHRATVLMSGGLDSTSVAAIAHDVMRRRFERVELTAYTFFYEHLIEDAEPRFARDAARFIGIPHCCIPLDDEGGNVLWADDAAWSAEPNELPTSARLLHRLEATHAATRVAFTGQGGDPALHVSPDDAVHRASQDGWTRSIAAMISYRLRHGAMPRVGLRTHVRRTLRGSRFQYEPRLPPWLQPGFAARTDLAERHRRSLDRNLDRRASRPGAAFQLAGPEWSFWLETCDPGANGFALEYRHPLLDVRLLELAMRLPVIPFLTEKHILRRVMGDHLPPSVLRRRKAPLADFPVHHGLLENRLEPSRLASLEGHLAQFIDVSRFRRFAQHPERLRAWEAELVTRPLGLALWLSRRRAGPNREGVAGGSSRSHEDKEAVS